MATVDMMAMMSFTLHSLAVTLFLGKTERTGLPATSLLSRAVSKRSATSSFNESARLPVVVTPGVAQGVAPGRVTVLVPAVLAPTIVLMIWYVTAGLVDLPELRRLLQLAVGLVTVLVLLVQARTIVRTT